jgi:RecB family endonuclease NucS
MDVFVDTTPVRMESGKSQKKGVRLLDFSEEMKAEEELENEAVETSLSLERDLEKSLISKLEQLELGLRLYKDIHVNGQQFNTGRVGRIDILGLDRNNDFVVIELKAGRADERVCNQILRYMGWVIENLAGDRKVRGIIVANEFSDFVKYAVKATPNVILKEYEVHFEFKDV